MKAVPKDELEEALGLDNVVAPALSGIAKQIVKLSDSAKDALNSGLKLETVVMLLSEKTGVGRRSVHKILVELPKLKSHYCRVEK